MVKGSCNSNSNNKHRNNYKLIQITNAGANYRAALEVTITGDGTGAQAIATVHNGSKTHQHLFKLKPDIVVQQLQLMHNKLVVDYLSQLGLGIIDNFTEQDGYIDNRKVKIAPYDADEDGMPDYP